LRLTRKGVSAGIADRASAHHANVMTVTLKPKAEITVPKSIRRKAGIKAGDRFEFTVSGRIIKIVPKPSPDDTLTPEEAKVVRRGEAQLRRGESRSWRAVKHELAR
jgi:AbrB family looped-hinge helix DNA binding protein